MGSKLTFTPRWQYPHSPLVVDLKPRDWQIFLHKYRFSLDYQELQFEGPQGWQNMGNWAIPLKARKIECSYRG